MVNGPLNLPAPLKLSASLSQAMVNQPSPQWFKGEHRVFQISLQPYQRGADRLDLDRLDLAELPRRPAGLQGASHGGTSPCHVRGKQALAEV